MVDSRINVLAKNFEEFTCFDHAEQMGNQEVAEYLSPVILKA